jgi:hypothetical protein
MLEEALVKSSGGILFICYIALVFVWLSASLFYVLCFCVCFLFLQL